MKEKNLYIQMFSIHGLIRSQNLELGRDADTGGQITYVLELGRALSRLEAVKRVDLFTRLIGEKSVSEDYSVPVEEVNDKFRIVRIQCGGKKYIRKELLWPHLSEFIDKSLKFIKKQNELPDLVHGHYADGGFVAMKLSEILGVPFVFTGHSLGRPKLAKLLMEGMSEEEIVRHYKIHTRIKNEERVLTNADLIVTSTSQEISDQYGLYDNKNLTDYRVIPPGIDVNRFYPYYHTMIPEFSRDEMQLHARASMTHELNRFLSFPEKPLILALCRPDKRKNIAGLIKAYGEDADLKAMANLAIFAGIRKDIADMEENEREVLTEMLLLMDKYDLYAKMAIPKKHNFDLEVPELYRIAAEKRGVFVNPALTEPFGLTLLEASSCGLPIIATRDGGPQDIVKNCENGILVNPSDSKDIAGAIKKILTDENTWDSYSMNGVIRIREHYTWEAHVVKYLGLVQRIMQDREKEPQGQMFQEKIPFGVRLTQVHHLLVTDIDNTLVGQEENDQLPQLLELLKQNRDHIGFVTASGRDLESTLEILRRHAVPDPDVIITSVGTEIFYGRDLTPDAEWERHIAYKWDPSRIMKLLQHVESLEMQEEKAQRPYKISYFLESGRKVLPEIHNRLIQNKCRYNLIYSGDRFLDILPYRASKGKAIRYLSYKWEIPMENMLVCGDSGNDDGMLRGDTLGVVVGNHSPELEKLRGCKQIYFSNYRHAQGIIDGMEHYHFIKKATGEKK